MFGIPVLGFLPLSRCCVVPFLNYLQRLCALRLGQLINSPLYGETEPLDVVVMGQSATLHGVCSARLADSPPRCFIQRRAVITNGLRELGRESCRERVCQYV